MWAASSTFLIRGTGVGVRSSSTALDAYLRRLLARYLVDDRDSPPSYSLVLGSGVHRLYRGSRLVVRARSTSRLVEGFLRHLDADTGQPTPLLEVDAVPLVAGTAAVVAPRSLRPRLARVQPHLARAGVIVVDVPRVLLDPRDAALVIPSPRLQVDEEVRAQAASLAAGARRWEPLVEDGRYRLRAWALGDALPASPAAALASAARLLCSTGRFGAQAGLEGLARILALAPPVVLAAAPAALGADVARLLRDGGP